MISLIPVCAAAVLLLPAQESKPATDPPAEVPAELPAETPVKAPVEAPEFVPPAEAPEPVEGALFTRFYHEDGTLAREGYLKDGQRVGIWKSWFIGGQRELHGAFQNYARVGPWIIYSEDGASYTHASYDKNGDRDGVWTTYFVADKDKGTTVVKGIAHWRHGRKHGSHERYARNGKLMSLVEFNEGVKDGRNLKFGRGGKNKLEDGHYSNGLQTGPWKIYMNNGVLKSEGSFEQGKRVGEWIEYFANESRESVVHWVDGVPDGPSQGFYKQGERRYRGTFKKGLLEGDYIEWWPSGDKKGEGAYKGGHFDGPWTFWDREGREDPSKTGVYRAGDLVR